VPELPDVTIYCECLERRLVGEVLEAVRVPSVSLLRTYDPPVEAAEGKCVQAIEHIGKRIVFAFEDELFLVFHLMIAGRFKWRERGAKVPRKVGLAAFDFPSGMLLLTEMGAKRRTSLHVIRGREALKEHDPGGIDVLDGTIERFRAALLRGNHTLKRALTDPRTFSGIGNAYSDEILHRARLSPLKWTTKLDDGEIERLWTATRETLTDWIQRLRDQVGEGFPEKVTAFRPEMAVHCKYKEPCPDCGAPVQRIVYASNETNYCAKCQTGGKVLADRGLSRLLKQDWPRTLEDWEALKG